MKGIKKQNEIIEIEGNKIRKTVFFKSIEEYLSTIGLPNWTNNVTPLNEVNMRKINKGIENNASLIGSGDLDTISKNLIGAINEINNKIDNGIEYISDIRLENDRIYLMDNKGNKLGNGFDAALFNGRDGKGLEYTWNGTELGIRKEGENSYSYANLKGNKGDKGDIGLTGLSAYEGACATGFKGSEAEWILSLKGSDGKDLEFTWDDTRLGIKKQGDSNFLYKELKGDKGENGQRGLSAYEIAVNEVGFEGDELQWIASLKGQKGDKGDGIKILGTYSSYSYLPTTGQVGDAYLVNMDLYIYDKSATPKPWVNAGQIKGEKGDTGLTGRQGQKGDTGKSAYQYWTELGNSGSTEEFINSLRGSDGKDLEFIWNGTQLGVRKQGENEYSYVQLKGERGDKGEQGNRGEIGKSIEYTWDNTQLGIKQEGEESYSYADLKGEKGDRGKSIEFVWNGTELGIKQEGAIDYSYANLKGEKGDRGDGINILGSLNSEDELPPTGEIGDAYIINNDLYVYDPNIFPKPWINVGNIKGEKGDVGEKGERGLNAYEVWLSQGNTGNVQEYLLSLRGEQGIQGETGLTGEKGDTGKSAYEIWLVAGNEGTIEDYLLSLKGEKGDSAYEVWLSNGGNGSAEEYLLSLKGEKGDKGDGISEEVLESINKIDDIERSLSNKSNINHTHDEVYSQISHTHQEFDDLKNLIGDTDLPTNNKTITGAISELFQDASNGKILIAQSITGKGIETEPDETFDSMSSKIIEIKSGYDIGDIINFEDINMYDGLPINKGNIDCVDGWCYGFVDEFDGNLYLALGDDSSKIKKIKKDGELIWELSIEGNPRAISNYIDNEIITSNYIGTKKIFKVSLEGKVIKELNINFITNSSYPRVIKHDRLGNIYIAASSGYVYKLNPSMEKEWEYLCHSSTITSMVIDDNEEFIYTIGSDSYIRKINNNGSNQWRYSTTYTPSDICIEKQNKNILFTNGKLISGRTISGSSISSITFDNNIEKIISIDDFILTFENNKCVKYNVYYTSNTKITYKKEWEFLINDINSLMLGNSLYESDGVIYISYLNQSNKKSAVEKIYYNCIEIK